MSSITDIKVLHRDLQQGQVPPAIITNVEPLTSYNWVEATTPTIVVPGEPPRWSPPRIAQRLPKDSGLVYVSQNAARLPKSPLEPLFRALYLSHPNFDVRSVDVVTDRNNIRKLLSFVDPNLSRNGAEPFTINVEMTRNTAILSRTETKTTELIGPNEFKGFGHEFEKAYTTSSIAHNTGHHRIVSYDFGGMKLVVRHEVDAYLEDAATPRPAISNKKTEDLNGLLDALSLSSNDTRIKAAPFAGSRLCFREEGRAVPLRSTMEIKTKVAHKPLPFTEIAPQLWVSQTPKLVLAYHKGGFFPDPKVEDVASKIHTWELENQASLKKLAVLIKKIIESAKQCGGRATVIFDAVTDCLVIRKVDGKPFLPQDLYSQWEDSEDSGASEEDKET